MLIINRKLSEEGFSLIELMVAVVILAIAVLGIFLAFSSAWMGMAVGRDMTVATNYAREAMEEIKNKTFEIIEISEGTRTPIDYDKGKFSILVTVQNEIIDTTEMTDLQRVITTVSWENRKGESREVKLEMLIYGYM
ncbi:hypothetical protein ES708_33222 [subsurface metagenome]